MTTNEDRQPQLPEIAGTETTPPARSRARRTAAPLSSKQQLANTIKTIRDMLRRDSGLSGDADRLPQLTWLLFLKQLDSFEESQTMINEDYQPVVEPPYRWRDWADPRKEDGSQDLGQRRRADEMISFVNDELIPYLSRRASTNPEYPLANIVGKMFQGITNRIRSGYVLLDVIERLSTINFNSSEDVHTISVFYEGMLREMRDAAGDTGEFYTPRPVVRFIIDRLKLLPTDKLLDPACGTGGFLVEAYNYLRESGTSASSHRAIQKNIAGIEKKSMPYLLGVVNLLLHGFNYPNIIEGNALATPINAIREDDRVDVIATNPPFGGEEERGILASFGGLPTAETALLFFQFVMAKLKRDGGRCGIVLPNGFLFGGGAAAEIKKELLNKFNLHTIVRLPNGVFAPYTSIPTNLLFFEAGGAGPFDRPCTQKVWYYELPLPTGRSSYSKTKPLQYEEFEPCRLWWEQREENDHAWCVPVETIIANGYNLDIKNPNSAQDFEHLPPEQLIEDIIAKEQRILDIMDKLLTLRWVK